MPLVVADTSPVFYLLSIGQIDLLPRFFGKVIVPDAVYKELTHPAAPFVIRQWAEQCPDWLAVTPVGPVEDTALLSLGPGERDAIALALSLDAKLILIDERKGTAAALARGLEATGTLGILRSAAQQRWINLADCFERLKRTNFRYRQEVLDRLLAEQR